MENDRLIAEFLGLEIIGENTYGVGEETGFKVIRVYELKDNKLAHFMEFCDRNNVNSEESIREVLSHKKEAVTYKIYQL